MKVKNRQFIQISTAYPDPSVPYHEDEKTIEELMEKDPRIVIEHAVRGMLQHNTLGAEQFNKLKVYVGSEHPHAAQKPIVLPKEAK